MASNRGKSAYRPQWTQLEGRNDFFIAGKHATLQVTATAGEHLWMFTDGHFMVGMCKTKEAAMRSAIKALRRRAARLICDADSFDAAEGDNDNEG